MSYIITFQQIYFCSIALYCELNDDGDEDDNDGYEYGDNDDTDQEPP